MGIVLWLMPQYSRARRQGRWDTVWWERPARSLIRLRRETDRMVFSAWSLSRYSKTGTIKVPRLPRK